MTYNTNNDLPESVRNCLPDEQAQNIYRQAFNNAYTRYASDKTQTTQTIEEVSSKMAWSAVGQQYEKHQDGKWYLINRVIK